jgi:phage shock protein PspC (stress-responsive transcriptional regulator)
MIQSLIRKIVAFFEKQAFGVCAWWGEKLKISTHSIRLIFIYLSFFTFGSPIVIYFFMAAILELKKELFEKRNRVWDL